MRHLIPDHGIFWSRARAVTAGGLVAGYAEHTIIMALEWTAEKKQYLRQLVRYGRAAPSRQESIGIIGLAEGWYIKASTLNGYFGGWSQDPAADALALGMPDEATFMVIATKYSNVKNGAGYYHTYIKTPKGGTVWQVKHNVEININPNEKLLKIGSGYEGAIYTTQLFAGKGLPFSVIVFCCCLLT